MPAVPMASLAQTSDAIIIALKTECGLWVSADVISAVEDVTPLLPDADEGFDI